MPRLLKIKLTLITLCLLISVSNASSDIGSAQVSASGSSADRLPAIPRGLPVEVWRRQIPPDNPLTPAKVALGRALYFEKRLSADGTISCATCHDPAAGFADHHPVAVGMQGRAGTRNAPTLLNIAFHPHLFWDGRTRTLEEQALQPLFNPAEMGMPDAATVVARLSALPAYRKQFRRAFGTGAITVARVAKALATFERTELSGNSPFDRFLAGEQRALSETQQRGWQLFQHKAQCIQCHTVSLDAPFFTDFQFHNSGVATKHHNLTELRQRAATNNLASVTGRPTAEHVAHYEGLAELGRYLVTGLAQDTGAFKTPTLRDIELTAPYMHDGSEKTLLDVIRFYNRGGVPNPYLDAKLRPLGLTEQEMSDVVEFLRALTSEEVLRRVQQATPQTHESVLVTSPRAKGRCC